jgi:GDP-mannose 6-dehydrogenase
MRISVFGLGYVGTVSAACLARDGHQVVGCDVDAAKLDLVRHGHSPIVEPGMHEVVARAVESGRLRVTCDVAEAVTDSDLSFICVGTPARADGSQDLTAIRRLLESLGTALKTTPHPHLIVVRSTVLPGTTQNIVRPLLEMRSGKRAGVDFDVCFQPEFLREGASLQDYDAPPFTVIGAESPRAVSILRRLYAALPADIHATSTAAAELLKYTCNAFHALKVAFANEIGRLGAALHIDPQDVMELLGHDDRLSISTAYLTPGLAFGGPCLPKDLAALIHLATERRVEVPLLSAVLPSNDLHIQGAVDAVLRTGGQSVGILGLSFKSGTDDLRQSPLAEMVRRLLQHGVDVRIYDHDVAYGKLLGANREFADNVVPELAARTMASCEALVHSCDVLVIARNDGAALETLRRHTRDEQILVALVDLPEDGGIRGTRAPVHR